ncbi:hypothetical protein WMY93_003201 [Mugilogobius chulae]|uniref:Activating transcription factor 7-interacting protein Fn3 domain-containing protein n=1 Tax=Mugilogobius chulae TaxID=88201 RepID=A0AAW0Q472_9GOBI
MCGQLGGKVAGISISLHDLLCPVNFDPFQCYVCHQASKDEFFQRLEICCFFLNIYLRPTEDHSVQTRVATACEAGDSKCDKTEGEDLDDLRKTIEQQEKTGMKYVDPFKVLQVRMTELGRRTQKALDHIAQQNSRTSLDSDTLVRSDSVTSSSAVLQPGVDISNVTEFMMIEGLAKLIKKEPADNTDITASAAVPIKRPKEEFCSPEMNRNPKRIKSEPEEVPYPLLPQFPFPSSLPLEATNYSVPPTVKVDLALIKNPSPQLSVAWTLDEDVPDAPPMASYSVYNATERAVDSGIFDEWQKVVELPAAPFPMFYLHKYRPGYKICVSVIGKDKFGRYGSFSKVVCAMNLSSATSAYPADPPSSGQTIRISKQELKRLIHQEVQCALKKKENSLDALIFDLRQHLGQEGHIEASIKMLQERCSSAPEHFSFFTLCIIHSSHTAALGQTDGSEAVILQKDKERVRSIHVENVALRAAIEDLDEQTRPSPVNNMARPNGVMKGLAKLLHIKKEPDDPQPAAEESVSVNSCCSPEVYNPKKIKLEKNEVPYPLLPELPFPTTLPLEAVKYNLPPKLKVDLALIKNPSPHLSVVWNLEENDPDAPPMATYSIYLTTEVAIGSNLFDGWKRLGEHAAEPLPMLSIYTKYKPGYKICVSVVGKDKFDRYGPFSEVTCGYI